MKNIPAKDYLILVNIQLNSYKTKPPECGDLYDVVTEYGIVWERFT